MDMAKLAPLEDRRYDPVHKPVNGRAPDVVAKWGPRSQRRWFERFDAVLSRAPHDYWDRFYCSSVEHRGLCCGSCIDDRNDGYTDIAEDHCCCIATRDADETEPGTPGTTP